MATVKEKKRKEKLIELVASPEYSQIPSPVELLMGSLRSKRSKGKGKGILGARETRGALPHRLLINRLGVVPDGLP